jgi:hypothetical protein
MLLFRSVAIGLLGACVLLLAQRPPRIARGACGGIVIEHELIIAPHVPAPTIIDVAPGLSTTQLAQLIRLAPDERVTAVDDRAVTGTLDAGTVLGAPGSRHFIDLAIAGRAGERRVLVLVH